MAVMRPVRRSGGGGARRTALSLTFVVGAVLLVTVLNRRAPRAGGRLLVEDQRTAEELFALAKAAGDARDFAARLQKAGLMAGASTPSKPVKPGKPGKPGGAKAAVVPGKPDANGKYVVPQLSRELAHSHARDDIIIVTWANYHFFDFVLNWVEHMQRHDIKNYLVGAMDVDTGQALAARGLNAFAMYDETAGEADTGLGKADFGWGSPTFHKMGRQKVDLARTFTDYGLDLCLCDVDTVWINDPTDYFERYAAADILASSDALAPSNPKGDDNLEEVETIHSAMNIGLLFFRHSKNTTRFIDAWQQQLDADSKAWDQNVFNHVAHQGLLPFQTLPDNDRLVLGANRSLVFGVLPVASFASGHTFFVQRLFEYQQVRPYVVHTTFQYGGTSGKRHRLREAMLWYDPPEYYSQGRFLSVELAYGAVPPDFQLQDQFMMEGQRFKTTWTNDQMADLHLKHMREQVLQLKTAFKLAVALNRTLIMPKLLAWCDKYWGPLEFCQVPGAFKTRLPFVAPMDHVLEPYNFVDDIGEAPKIPFREYSFLENERTPAKLKNTRVVVRPVAGLKGPEEAKAKDGQKVLKIPQGLLDTQLRETLSRYDDVQLLHFDRLAKAHGGWADKADRGRFQHRMSHMMSFFCCKKVPEGEDGGFAYYRFIEDPNT